MTATTANPLTLAQVDAEKQSTRSQLKIDAGFAAAGFGVAAAAALLFPPLGIVGLVGAVMGLSNTIDAARSATQLSALNKGERELSEGKTEETRTRAAKLGTVAKTGRRVSLAIGLGILGLAVATIVAPALLPVTLPMISTIAWPALGLLAVVRSVDGAARGAQAVVNAVDNPAPPAPPAAAAPEAAAKPSRFASLKKLFTRSAAPANDDTKPAAPAAAPAAPKADAPKP